MSLSLTCQNACDDSDIVKSYRIAVLSSLRQTNDNDPLQLWRENLLAIYWQSIGIDFFRFTCEEILKRVGKTRVVKSDPSEDRPGIRDAKLTFDLREGNSDIDTTYVDPRTDTTMEVFSMSRYDISYWHSWTDPPGRFLSYIGNNAGGLATPSSRDPRESPS